MERVTRQILICLMTVLLGVCVPSAGHEFEGCRAFVLVSVYGPVSGLSADTERRVIYDGPSMFQFQLQSVWLPGRDLSHTKAEV